MDFILETILAFCAFAFVASITPGPTNFLILSTSHQFSIRKTVGLIFGGSIGAALLVLITGLSVGTTLNEYQNIKLILSLLGGIWLSYVSWQIFNYFPDLEAGLQNKKKKNGFSTGFFLQLINPKSWLMAIAVITVYTPHVAHYHQMLIILSFIFMLISLPCLFVWAYLGQITQKMLSTTHHMVFFNRVLGTVFFISVWYPIFHSIFYLT